MATSDIKKGPLYVDSTNNRVGVGLTTPERVLHVNAGTNNNCALFESTDANADIYLQDSGATGNTSVGLRGQSNDLVFITNASETARLLSGGGITFNGDTAAANALDDYEEGTWTPSVSYGSGSSYTTITSPNVALGAYRKIGSLLYISFYFYKNSSPIGGSGGAWRVNVPFAIIHGSNTGYSSIPVGYWTLNGTNYFNSIPTRLQANSSGFLDMYGAQGSTAWSSGNYELAGHGLLMTT